MFFSFRMDLHSPDEFAIPTPTLSFGIALCDGIPRTKWNTKYVTIINEAREDVANGV